MRSLMMLWLLMTSSLIAAEDFSLVTFLKTCGKDRVLDSEAAGLDEQVGKASSAILERIYHINEKNGPLNKALEPGFVFHLRALDTVEKRFEKPLGWRKGDTAFSVTVDYRAGGVAEFFGVINARSGRLAYTFGKDPKIAVGDGKDDELTPDEIALAEAGLNFYSLGIHHQDAPDKLKPLLHPTVRKSFKLNLRPGSRLLPVRKGDGHYALDGVQVQLDGAVGTVTAMDGFLMLRLKREGQQWLVLDMKEQGK